MDDTTICPLCGATDHERTVVGATTYIACPKVPNEMTIDVEALRVMNTPRVGNWVVKRKGEEE